MGVGVGVRVEREGLWMGGVSFTLVVLRLLDLGLGLLLLPDTAAEVEVEVEVGMGMGQERTASETVPQVSQIRSQTPILPVLLLQCPNFTAEGWEWAHKFPFQWYTSPLPDSVVEEEVKMEHHSLDPISLRTHTIMNMSFLLLWPTLIRMMNPPAEPAPELAVEEVAQVHHLRSPSAQSQHTN